MYIDPFNEIHIRYLSSIMLRGRINETTCTLYSGDHRCSTYRQGTTDGTYLGLRELEWRFEGAMWTNGWCEGILCHSVPLSSILPWAGGSREAGRYAIMLSRDKDRVQMSSSLASAAKREA